MELTQEVINFVAAQTSVSAKRIRLDTSVCKGLKVVGDDGHELLEKFAKRFSVDMTGVDSTSYFGTEGANPFLWFFPSKLPKISPLTIEDLVKAAERGTWFEK